MRALGCLAQRPEARANFFREQLWLLPRREVSALLDKGMQLDAQKCAEVVAHNADCSVFVVKTTYARLRTWTGCGGFRSTRKRASRSCSVPDPGCASRFRSGFGSGCANRSSAAPCGS